MTDYKAIMKGVLNSDSNIIGVAIIKEDVNIQVKAGAPKIEEIDLVRMATQAQQAISIGKTNERLLGELGCIVFYHKFIAAMLFPLDTIHVLAVGVGRIQNVEQLAFKIKELTKAY